MQKLIEEKIEILKESNKFNLESITKEEIGEFREARIEYAKALERSDDKKFIQKKFEAMLDEISDVMVVTRQWEFPERKLRESLTVDEYYYIEEIIKENKDYINAVMLYKMERTLIRNLMNWYK